jgi:hypothetical protein
MNSEARKPESRNQIEAGAGNQEALNNPAEFSFVVSCSALCFWLSGF